jgi:hypothetical protein
MAVDLTFNIPYRCFECAFNSSTRRPEDFMTHSPPVDRLDAAVDSLGALADMQDLSEDLFLENCLAKIGVALDVPLAKYLELSGSKRWLRVRSGIGWPEGIVGSALVANDTRSFAGLTLCMGSVVRCDDLGQSILVSDSPLLRRIGVVSSLWAVVTTAGKASVPGDPARPAEGVPLGVVSVHTVSRRHFRPVEVRFLARTGRVMARGLERLHASRARSAGAPITERAIPVPAT